MSLNSAFIGGNTVAINTGTSSYILNDKNANGVIDRGDVLVRATQAREQLTTYVVGSDEAMNLHGDPHLDNLKFADGGAGLTSVANQVFQQARGGGETSVHLIDGEIAKAGVDNIGDIHADAALVLENGTLVEVEMAFGENRQIAYSENADITLTSANGGKFTLTITDIWSGNGGRGAMQVRDTTHDTNAQAIADGLKVPAFHELDGANVLYGVTGFGTDFGTPDRAYILDSAGNVDLTLGRRDRQSLWAHAVISSHSTNYEVAREFLLEEDNRYEEKHLESKR